MSDVLQCNLIQVGGLTYRMHTPALPRQTPVAQEQAAAYLSNLENDPLDCTLEDDPAIRREDGMFTLPFRVDEELFPFIVGREGRKKREIEESTGASLQIPRTQRAPAGAPRQKAASSETITIKAADKASVLRAKARLDLLVSTTLNSRSLDYTHFVSIPLQSPATHSKLEEFQQQVLSAPYAADCCIEPSIFCSPSSLHLTVVMLKLYSDEARGRAQQLLKELQPALQELLGGLPLVLTLQGLEYMRDDPSDVHVLYLKVHSETSAGEAEGGAVLEQLFRLVFQRYKEAGLLVEGEREELKIHATVINTRYRRSSSSGKQHPTATSSSSSPSGAAGAAASGRIGIDARKLLADHKGLDVGKVEVQAVHLSQRGMYDKGGHYQALAQVPLSG